MDELLASLCKLDHKMKSLAITQKAEMEELLYLMQTHHKVEVANAYGEAKVVIPAGRKSTWIDPKKFFKKVPEGDFFASITVGMEKAKKVLSEKEIASISTVTPAVPGEPALKIIPA